MTSKPAQKLILATSGLFGLYFSDSNQFHEINDNGIGSSGKFNIINCNADTSNNPNDKSVKKLQDEALQKAIVSTKNLVWTKMNYSAVPGLVIGVSVDGKTVYRGGFGYADVENRVLATQNHVMRIASISKPLAMVAAARLYEDGKLDLDKPITEYVKSWPEKHPPITVRQIASHTSGIRHYKKNPDCDEMQSDDHDTKYPEFYSNIAYKNIEDALEVFKTDDLLCEPGTEFNYTTHGYTLLSAVIESVSGEPFLKYIQKLFRELGLHNTYLDENGPIIPYRSRYYQRNKEHQLQNVPAVDNSLKWAGGGFLSTVSDLLQFGNAMLYSFQYEDSSGVQPPENVAYKPSPFHSINSRNEKMALPPFLKPDTMKLLWDPVIKTSKDGNGMYGLGWAVMESKEEYAFAKKQRFFTSHTGGAVGASSVLLIFPCDKNDNTSETTKPKGVVVAIICNMQNVGLGKLALDVAKLFEKVPVHENQFKVRKLYQC